VGNDALNLAILFDDLGYSGTNPITGGYLRIQQMGANTQVQIDPDGSSSTGSSGFSTLVTLNNFVATDLIIGSNLIV
jgi:hypothetical protein